MFAYLDPCGCRVDPIGGVYRRWNATAVIPRETRLSVDAGNLFFVSATPAESMVPQWREQARSIIEAYNQLDWDAFTPGANDFALGVKELLTLEKSAKFAFVSANLVDAKSEKNLFKPHVIVDRLGKKIGIFGLFSPELPLPAGVRAQAVLPAAKKQVELLRRRGVDLIVALTHQGLEADRELAKAIEGIDVIVGAHTQSFLQTPEKINKSTIVQLSSKGQVFGILDIEFTSTSSEKSLVVGQGAVVDLDSRFDASVDLEKFPTGGFISGRTNPMKGLIAAHNIRLSQSFRQQSQKVWQEGKKIKGVPELEKENL